MKTPKNHYPDLERLAIRIEAGDVTPIIDKAYPLNQAPAAMRRFEAGYPRGSSSSRFQWPDDALPEGDLK